MWPLHMPQREKYTIAGSMSLGLMYGQPLLFQTQSSTNPTFSAPPPPASNAPPKLKAYTPPTTSVRPFSSPLLFFPPQRTNPTLTPSTEDSVGLIVWSSAEMAITLICIGIPVCRPLYKRAFRRIFGETSSSAGYRKQSNNHDGGASNSVPLRTIGGGLIGPDGKPIPGSKKHGGGGGGGASTGGNTGTNTAVDRDGEGSDGISFSEVKLGVNGPFTRTTVGRGRRGSGGDNTSDEEILGEEYRRSHLQSARRSDEERETTVTGGGRGAHRLGHGQGIMVTETYRVERS